MKSKLCLCCKRGYAGAGVGAFDICPVCGWEDDDIQADDPDYVGDANELSLNDYRKEYEKTRKNPNYIWEKEAVKLNYNVGKPTNSGKRDD